jgi:hypothetical protein
MPARVAFLMTAALLGTAAFGATNSIPDVPGYLWYNGCGPTATGMIIGFWDAHGFGNLIAAGDGTNSWDTNRQAVKDMIASPGHIRDYVPTPDRVATPTDPYHPDDCVADFMRASRNPLGYGASFEDMQYVGLSGYAGYRGYHGADGYYVYFSSVWNRLVTAINSNRPAELFVDSNADGMADHFVTAIGYDDTAGAQKYAAYNTYDRVVHWYSYAPVQSGRAYGVESGTFFRIFLPGDANRDGDVDFQDYQALEGNFGRTVGVTWSMGDFDADGDVDFTDYQALELNFGHAAPEPVVTALLLLGACALGISRRR